MVRRGINKSSRSRQQTGPMRLCLPAALPNVPFYINYRPCFCGKELIVETIPMYQTSNWTSNSYPTSSCLSGKDSSISDKYSVFSAEYNRQFFPENLHTVKSNYPLPEYPSYPEVQFKTLSNSKHQNKSPSKGNNNQRDGRNKSLKHSDSLDNLDR